MDGNAREPMNKNAPEEIPERSNDREDLLPYETKRSFLFFAFVTLVLIPVLAFILVPLQLLFLFVRMLNVLVFLRWAEGGLRHFVERILEWIDRLFEFLRWYLFPVFGEEWRAWPGGQLLDDLNPTEVFQSADFGFTGEVDWKVDSGGTAAVIIQPGGPRTTARSSLIVVRYPSVSPTAARADAVFIEATKAGVTLAKLRTVFKARPRVQTIDNLDTDNALRFPTDTGTSTDRAEFNKPGERGATRISAKTEVIFDFEPKGIPWSERGVNFRLNSKGSVDGNTKGAKGDCVARREINSATGVQVNGKPFRIHSAEGPDEWRNDGTVKTEDGQYPTDAKPDKAFRIDAPGDTDLDAYVQFYDRKDFREFLEWHDGNKWSKITDDIIWYVSITQVDGRLVEPNHHGPGRNPDFIQNRPPIVTGQTFVVAPGDVVTLKAVVQDPDNDPLEYTDHRWVQTAGPPVALSLSGVGAVVVFTVPNAPATLKFKLTVDDATKYVPRSPGNSRGEGEYVVEVRP
ncbi:MAG: hypothetical protein E3K37_06140 [Candidatus Kuenenia sp.]|nr:hypothetical protein [Candidatus Kuenenia hertensis]